MLYILNIQKSHKTPITKWLYIVGQKLLVEANNEGRST